MSGPVLSNVIPTYDRREFLERAVRSALAQTFANLEVLVVDDGSPKPVELSCEDPRLRILHLPCNGGHAAARNVGAREAAGKWIAYLDDDDELLPHMVEVSLQGFRQVSVVR